MKNKLNHLKISQLDIATGYFIIKEGINEIDYSDYLYESNVYIIVRYCNLPESIEFKKP